jgi:hypothetical protein
MGFSTESIEQIDSFERRENLSCLNHQQINSDGLEGAIRNPTQQEEVVGRAYSGFVCSLPFVSTGELVASPCLPRNRLAQPKKKQI